MNGEVSAAITKLRKRFEAETRSRQQAEHERDAVLLALSAVNSELAAWHRGDLDGDQAAARTARHVHEVYHLWFKHQRRLTAPGAPGAPPTGSARTSDDRSTSEHRRIKPPPGSGS